MLGFDDGRRTFSEDDLRFLRAVVNVVAAANERHQARQQLERLLLSKDEFIASVSHELRTPLTVIAGVAHELHETWTDLDDVGRQEYLALAVEQTRDMQDLIEDLLVAARADIGRVSVHLAPMDLAPVVQSVAASLGPTKAAAVSYDLQPAHTTADAVRVRQIVRNLVTNAFRYGGPNVVVATGSARSRAYVRVVDDGDGIDPSRREAIFEAYESAHDGAGRSGSVGLGLTVARRLAELMNGELTYHYNGQSVFELSLPSASTARAQDGRPFPSRVVHG
jgi:signal transduction histidine kinase